MIVKWISLLNRGRLCMCTLTLLGRNRIRLIYRRSLYRAVNTLCLGYINRYVNVVKRHNCCLFWDPLYINKCIVRGTEFLNVITGGTLVSVRL